MYQNWIGRPAFLIGRDLPTKSYVDDFIENDGKENFAGHSVILPVNEAVEIRGDKTLQVLIMTPVTGNFRQTRELIINWCCYF